MRNRSREAPHSPKSQYLFIDESGDFDFAATGTNHFVMAGILTSDPLKTALPLQRLRYTWLERGLNVSSFHASPDLQEVRNSVIEEIVALSEIEAHVVFGRKDQMHPSLKNVQNLHFHFTTEIVRHHLEAGHISDDSRLVVVVDQSLPAKGQSSFHASIKPIFKLRKGDFRVFFQSMKTDYNGQIADYVAWAKFKQLERGEHRPWQALSGSLMITEQEISGNGAVADL